MAELKKLKNTIVCYPVPETWFICWDNDRKQIKAYGSILPTQCMETKFVQIDYYDKELDWSKVLLKNGINPFE